MPGRLASPDRRTTLVAATIGGTVGALASFLIHIPFIRFADAASLPGVLTVPYLVFVMLAGAAAGIIAVSVRHGWLIGALAYLAGGYLFGVLVHGTGSAILMPPEMPFGWDRMHTIGIGAGVITAASVLVALALVRLVGMRGLFPGLLPLPFVSTFLGWRMRDLAALMYATDDNGDPVVARVVAGLVFVMGLELFFLIGGWDIIRRDQIRVVQGSPVTMVAHYAWLASQPSPDDHALSLFTTSDLAKLAERDPQTRAAMRLPMKSLNPSARAKARSIFIDSRHAIREVYSTDRRSVGIVLPVDPASGCIAVTDSAINAAAESVVFLARREDGRWRIAEVPVRFTADSQR